MKMDTIGAGRSKTRQRSSRAKSARSTKPSRSRAGKTTKNAARTGRRGTSARSSRARSGRAQSKSARGSGSAKSTTNLNEIRRWAESRGGKPVSVIGTSRRGGAGLLRIDFPGYSGAGRFEEISWDEWYEKFQESKLEFLYQDRAANGGQSRFFKLVNRGTSARKSPSRRSASSKSGTRARSSSTASKAKRGRATTARRSSGSNSRSRARSR